MSRSGVLAMAILFLCAAPCALSVDGAPMLTATYRVGEPVALQIGQNTTELTIAHGEERYQLMDQAAGTVTFVPRSEGEYTVTWYEDGVAQQATFSVEGTAPALDNQAPDAMAADSLAATPTVELKDSAGRAIAANITVTDLQGGRSQLAATPLSEGYALEIRPEDTPLSAISLRGVPSGERIAIGLENVVDAIPRTDTWQPAQAYAIDPSATRFTEGLVTVKAQGSTVWKCALWNFTARACAGTWERFMDVVPGTEYSFAIGPTDPAWAETFDPNTTIDVGMTALDNTTLVIAFIDGDTNNHASFEIWDANGTRTVNEVDVDTTGSAGSRIAIDIINRTHFAIAITDGPANDAIVSIYNRSGNRTSGPTTLNANIGTNTDQAVCEIGDRFGVAYANDNSNDASMRVVWNNGTIATAEVSVDAGIAPGALRQNLVDCVALNASAYAYAFYDDADNDATIAVISGTGTTLAGPTDIDTDVGETGQVATARLRGNRFAVAFYDSTDQDVTIAIVSNTGAILAGPTDIDTTAGTDSRVAATEVERDGASLFAVAWQDAGSGTIAAAVYNSSGAQMTAPFTVTSTPNTTFTLLDLAGANSNAGLGLCNGTFAIAYANRTTGAAFDTYYANGTRWDGVCDAIPPNVTLNDPSHNSTVEGIGVDFNFTVTDNRDGILKNCTLYTNTTGAWTANRTLLNVTGGLKTNITLASVPEGVHAWNVLCYDMRGNGAFAAANFTVRIFRPDLKVTPVDIWFAASGIEGENATVFANVTNVGLNLVSKNFTVQLYRGNSTGGQQIGANITVPGLNASATITVNVSYTLSIGANQVFVIVDPANQVNETNETNNNASASRATALYQTYYGNATANVTLGENSNKTFSQWQKIDISGAIYVADYDTAGSIQFAQLKPLGRNTTQGTGSASANDFEELDAILGTANLTDSLNRTYTSGGVPISTETITIYGASMPNVPIVNSTGGGNFTTGILWDTTDSTNAHYDTADKEDVVFVTAVHQDRIGAYGIADYEIKVPSRLKDYRGATASVAIYTEIT
jgi:hypothetical protein